MKSSDIFNESIHNETESQLAGWAPRVKPKILTSFVNYRIGELISQSLKSLSCLCIAAKGKSKKSIRKINKCLL